MITIPKYSKKVRKSEMIQLENGKYFSYDMVGEFHSVGEWLHPKRKISSHELILVLEGTVYIAEKKEKYALQKDHVLLLDPMREHYGYQAVNEPTTFFWFHFFTDMEMPLKHYVGNDIYEIKHLLKKLLHISNTATYSTAAADATGYLIYEELFRLAAEKNECGRELFAKIREYIRINLKKGLTVSDIAAQFGYNVDYIGKYFKKMQGVGLKEYLAAQRMKLAKDLLLTTDMSVKQIARKMGYEEENLFIKFFIYHEKISPTVFKSKYYNTHINNK